jgi:hypothetical protein
VIGGRTAARIEDGPASMETGPHAFVVVEPRGIET